MHHKRRHNIFFDYISNTKLEKPNTQPASQHIYMNTFESFSQCKCFSHCERVYKTIFAVFFDKETLLADGVPIAGREAGKRMEVWKSGR